MSLRQSCPSWARGLKYLQAFAAPPPHVVPLVGTWIEIKSLYSLSTGNKVVPLVGTWIEMVSACSGMNYPDVVPLVGTWIEIFFITKKLDFVRRAPRGHVD